jgi:type IV pilus assembly protein PilO
MTNLQAGSSQVSAAWLRAFWLGVPIALGGLVAFLLLASVVLPLWVGLQHDLKRRQQMEELRQQVFLSRAQIRALDGEEERAQAQQSKLFEIVSGSGDLSTLMAMLDQQAKLAGVQLDLFEPQAAPPPASSSTDKRGESKPAGQASASPGAPTAKSASEDAGNPGQTSAGAPTDGAPDDGDPGAAARDGDSPSGQIKGLNTETILISTKGSYPGLIDFLRRLELLNVLVMPSDLQLSRDDKAGAAGSAAAAATNQPQPVLMKLLITVYGAKPSEATPGAGRARRPARHPTPPAPAAGRRPAAAASPSPAPLPDPAP